MSDRIIRDELLESVRWCDLPSDSHRVVFIALVLRADDFGNLEGGNRRLFRWMHGFTQIKTDADSIKVMSDLQDADLVRRYEVGGKEFWHLPRTNCTRTYIARIVPASPWDDPETEKKLSFQKLKNHLKQRPVEKTTVGLQQDSGSTFLGVRGKGLGEGKGEGQEKVKSIGTPRASRLPPDWEPNQSEVDYCKTKRPDLDPALVAEAFRDYWKSAPRGTKLDWSATWRTWVRNEKAKPGTSGQPHQSALMRGLAQLEAMKSKNKLNVITPDTLKELK